MAMKNVKSLLQTQLNELYAAEKHAGQVFPKMADVAASPKLQKTLREFTTNTKKHRSRLEGIFEDVGVKPRQHESRGMKGLLEDCLALTKDSAAEPHVRDAAMIAVAQHVQHDEIAGYGCAKALATLLGHAGVETQLDSALKETKQADATLTKIAADLNKEALVTAGA